MTTVKSPVPEPKSRFVKIACNSCDSVTILFTMATSIVNCRFCGDKLADPTGGKPQIFGRSHGVVDSDLSRTTIKTIQKSGAAPRNLLLDTMIIHQLINGQPIGMLVSKSSASDNLVILDRILHETINMEKEKYGVSFTSEEIMEKLQQSGKIEIIQVDHASEEITNARTIYESKKYSNEDGIALSETDCILLGMHLARRGDLVTFDRALIEAADLEGRPATLTTASPPNYSA